VVLVLAVLGAGGSGALAARNAPTKGAGRMPAAAKRMKAKLAQRPKGANTERPHGAVKRAQRDMRRAMSRREVGLGGSESKRTRERVARGIGDGTPAKHTLKFAWQKRAARR
jgi:hypothetical protein